MVLDAARDIEYTPRGQSAWNVEEKAPRHFDMSFLEAAPQADQEDPLMAALEARKKVQGLLQMASGISSASHEYDGLPQETPERRQYPQQWAAEATSTPRRGEVRM